MCANPKLSSSSLSTQQLRGNTFDATHLDKFLSSGYGEKGLGSTGAVVAPQQSYSVRRDAQQDQQA